MNWALPVVALALLGAAVSDAAELQGRIVHVIDGDGLIVLVGDKRLNVRLEHIDAPELKQPYGIQSRQSLIAICGGEVAKVEQSGKDRNGRTLGRAICNGRDAGAEQVRRGLAHVFERYAPADSPLYRLQEDAQAAKRGVWAQSPPVVPWEWRLTNKRQ